MKEDIKLIHTYFEENGNNIYGRKYLGYDAGKDNLESHFCNKLKWTKKRLKETIRLMEDICILSNHPKDAHTTRLLSYTDIGIKIDSYLKLIEL
jgi:hypothetical protein